MGADGGSASKWKRRSETHPDERLAMRLSRKRATKAVCGAGLEHRCALRLSQLDEPAAVLQPAHRMQRTERRARHAKSNISKLFLPGPPNTIE